MSAPPVASQAILTRCTGASATNTPPSTYSTKKHEKSSPGELLLEIDTFLTRFARVNDSSPPISIQHIEPLLRRIRTHIACESPASRQLETIEKGIARIEKQLLHSSKPPSTYAEALASGSSRGAYASRSFPAHEAPKEAPHLQKQINIKISSEDVEKVKSLSTAAIIEGIQNGVDDSHAARRIIAGKKLASGDLVVHVQNVQDKNKLQADTEWITRLYPSAQIVQKTYPVLVHGVSAAAIGREAGEGPARVLEKQNQSLHPGMKISRLAWIKKLDEKKAFSSLIVEVSDAATANRIISEGVIHGHELKRAELYDKTYKITRCFNY